MKTSIAAILLLNIFLLSACVDNRNASEADITTLPEAPKDSLGNPKMIMDNDMMHALSGTMAKMNQLEMSGAFDLDFANMMILHHQAAIDMSKIEIAQGRDAELKKLAQQMIVDQNSEIEEFKAWIINHK